MASFTLFHSQNVAPCPQAPFKVISLALSFRDNSINDIGFTR